VQHLLNAHPDIVIDGEGSFAWRLTPLLRQSIAQFNEHLSQFGKGSHIQVNMEEQRELLRYMICMKFRAYIRRSSLPLEEVGVVGDKTPQHSTTMPELLELFPDARFIHVVRDPRDTAVSAWFHYERLGQLTDGQSMQDHAATFIDGPWKVAVGSVLLAERNMPGKVLHVRYEDLQQDTVEHVTRMATFLNVDCDCDTIERCVTSASFDTQSGGRAPGEADQSSYYRKGVVGDWKNHLSPTEASCCCQSVLPLMQYFGYAVSEPAETASASV